MVLSQALDRIGTPDDFLGHIEGDDFIAITTADLVVPLARGVSQRFDSGAGTHYNWQDRQQGYLMVHDQAGNEEKVDLMTLSVGVVKADDGPFSDIGEITEVAARARREGKLAGAPAA